MPEMSWEAVCGLILEAALDGRRCWDRWQACPQRRQGTHSALHTSSSAPGHGSDCICKAEKETEENPGTSEQPVAAHTSSSQWTDAAEHPHKPGASLNQRRSSTVVNVYIHTYECFISASLLWYKDPGRQGQAAQQDCSPASHQRAAATLLLSQPGSSPDTIVLRRVSAAPPEAKTWLGPGFHRLLLDEPSCDKTSYCSIGVLGRKKHPKILPNAATGQRQQEATDGEYIESAHYPGTGGASWGWCAAVGRRGQRAVHLTPAVLTGPRDVSARANRQLCPGDCRLQS